MQEIDIFYHRRFNLKRRLVSQAKLENQNPSPRYSLSEKTIAFVVFGLIFLENSVIRNICWRRAGETKNTHQNLQTLNNLVPTGKGQGPRVKVKCFDESIHQSKNSALSFNSFGF